MLKLQGTLPVLFSHSHSRYLVTVTKNPRTPLPMRNAMALLAPPCHVRGFKAILTNERTFPEPIGNCDVFYISEEYAYLEEGDIVRLDAVTGDMRSLYRKQSPHNTILLTEQCDHYCLMCSQPPKDRDDSWLLREAFDLIGLIPPETECLGFSGGEPTLYGNRFIELLSHASRCLPRTEIDILSHGRAFKNFEFARQYASVQNPNMVVGIPIYSDDPVRHDYVVQKKGAFDETIKGIINLKRLGQRVEIRIVIHRQTIPRLRQTCEFIARNLLFVDHVALMGLEITGFARLNLESLWVDPYEYKDTLSEAVSILNGYGLNASVYNHQLCTVNPDVLLNYRRSISDWKTEYLDECQKCAKLNHCGGLFASSKKYRHSQHIKAFQ